MEHKKVLGVLVTSLLCLNLQHETLLRSLPFGDNPAEDALDTAVAKTVELVNEVLVSDGLSRISGEVVRAFVGPAWNKACQIDRLARHPADQWQRGNSSVL